jgi:hypothetical protein
MPSGRSLAEPHDVGCEPHGTPFEPHEPQDLPGNRGILGAELPMILLKTQHRNRSVHPVHPVHAG